MPENYAIDKKYPKIIYIHMLTWIPKGKRELDVRAGAKAEAFARKILFIPQDINLVGRHSIRNSGGLLIRRRKEFSATNPVRSGGEMEISKSMERHKIWPVYIHDLEKDSEMIDVLINYNYSNRWKSFTDARPSAAVKPSPYFRIGSEIADMSDQYSDEYNRFLEDIPTHVKILTLHQRMHRSHLDKGLEAIPECEIVNGRNGNSLRQAQ